MKLMKLSLVMLLVAGSVQAGAKSFWGGVAVGSFFNRPARVVVEDGASSYRLRRIIRGLESDIDRLYRKLNKAHGKINDLEEELNNNS